MSRIKEIDYGFNEHHKGTSASHIAGLIFDAKSSHCHSLILAAYWHIRSGSNNIIPQLKAWLIQSEKANLFQDQNTFAHALECLQDCNLPISEQSEDQRQAREIYSELYSGAKRSNNAVVKLWCAARLETLGATNYALYLYHTLVNTTQKNTLLYTCASAAILYKTPHAEYAKTCIAIELCRNSIDMQTVAPMITSLSGITCTDNPLLTAKKLLKSALKNPTKPDHNAAIELARIYDTPLEDRTHTYSPSQAIRCLFKQYIRTKPNTNEPLYNSRAKSQLKEVLESIAFKSTHIPEVLYYLTQMAFVDGAPLQAFQYLIACKDDLYMSPKFLLQLANAIRNERDYNIDSKLPEAYKMVLDQATMVGSIEACFKLVEHHRSLLHRGIKTTTRGLHMFDLFRASSKAVKIAYLKCDAEPFHRAVELQLRLMADYRMPTDPFERLQHMCTIYELKLLERPEIACSHLSKPVSEKRMQQCFPNTANEQSVRNLIRAYQSVHDVATLCEDYQIDTSTTESTHQGLLPLLASDYQILKKLEAHRGTVTYKQLKQDCRKGNLLAICLAIKQDIKAPHDELTEKLAQLIRPNKLIHYFILATKKPQAAVVFDILYHTLREEIQLPAEYSKLVHVIALYYFLLHTPNQHLDELIEIRREHDTIFTQSTCVLRQLFVLNEAQSEALVQAKRATHQQSPSVMRRRETRKESPGRKTQATSGNSLETAQAFSFLEEARRKREALKELIDQATSSEVRSIPIPTGRRIRRIESAPDLHSPLNSHSSEEDDLPFKME